MPEEAKTPSPQAQPQPAAPPRGGAGRGGRPGAPRRRQSRSRYAVQMREKQDLKKIYGIREEQLRKYYREAKRQSEQTGLALITLLERRLDNALFRAGFAPTRPAARQLATHGLLTINGRRVDIPSRPLAVGDVVAVKEGKRKKPLFVNFQKSLQNANPPAWLTIDPAAYSLTVTALPSAEEANVGVEVQSIIEYFAR
jgi:small subunit ribosomal protein S4